MKWFKEVSGEWKFTCEKCATTTTSNPSASGTREGIEQVSMCGGHNEAPRDVVRTRKRGGLCHKRDKPRNQATRSKAIGSNGGDHDKRLADSTVEGEIPMSVIKRPRGCSNTMSGTVEYTERCPGCSMEYTERGPGREGRWRPTQRLL